MPSWVEDHPGMKPASQVWAFKTKTRNAKDKWLLVVITNFADPFTGGWVVDESEVLDRTRFGKQAYRTAIRNLIDLGLLKSERVESGKICLRLLSAPLGLVPAFDADGNSYGWGDAT
jgi:hypothetical protein